MGLFPFHYKQAKAYYLNRHKQAQKHLYHNQDFFYPECCDNCKQLKKYELTHKALTETIDKLKEDVENKKNQKKHKGPIVQW